jgi:hypothetical protein
MAKAWDDDSHLRIKVVKASGKSHCDQEVGWVRGYSIMTPAIIECARARQESNLLQSIQCNAVDTAFSQVSHLRDPAHAPTSSAHSPSLIWTPPYLSTSAQSFALLHHRNTKYKPSKTLFDSAYSNSPTPTPAKLNARPSLDCHAKPRTRNGRPPPATNLAHGSRGRQLRMESH